MAVIVLNQIDEERYTKIPDMEGPFMTRSGKVLYYDKAVGRYYDRDSDFYITDQEFFDYDRTRKTN
jgi:hypothetical protein|tara:strand:- start:13195 stop:13392 length:198 start_codon:yes stop_codon:yes gene_type:complete